MASIWSNEVVGLDITTSVSNKRLVIAAYKLRLKVHLVTMYSVTMAMIIKLMWLRLRTGIAAKVCSSLCCAMLRLLMLNLLSFSGSALEIRNFPGIYRRYS